MVNEMKSLTLNGKTYDSFPDQQARKDLEQKQPKGSYVKTVNGASPDAEGNVKITIPDSSQDAVLYTEQTLTEEQQAQARENIGAMPSDAVISLTTEQVNALNALFRAASYTEDVSSAYAAFCDAFGLVNPDVPDEPSGDVLVLSVKQGSVSFYNGKMNLDGTMKTRATVVPIGQYLKKGVNYRFSLGDAVSIYAYGVQIFVAESAGMEFPHANESVWYEGVSARILDSGWLSNAYEYTPDVDNCILAVNFKRKDSGNMNESDYATIIEHLTIEKIE